MRTLILLYISLFITSVYGQQSATTKTTQPTIMVIPFAKENQSIRTVLENNELYRIAVTKVKEAFDARGVNTIDLIAKIKQTNNTEVLKDGQAQDFKDDVIAASGADIYVQVEASANYSSSGNSANVILTAYDAFSGESLANKTGNSPKIYTENHEKLVEKAIESQIDNLLNMIQTKFDEIIINGRTITLNVGIEDGTSITMDTEVDSDGNLLSEAIEAYIEKAAFKNQYHIQGSTQNQIKFDLVKIPLLDESGKNYRVSKFAGDFRKYFKTLGLEAKQTIQGSNIVMTVSSSK